MFAGVRTGLLIYRFTEAKAIPKICAEIAGSAPKELTFQVRPKLRGQQHPH